MFNKTASITIALVALMVPFVFEPASALEFECEKDGDSRFIRQELPGITNLCEVTVTNASKERKVMWYANHDTMFCTEKTIELKTKYTDKWGFTCSLWPDHDGVDQLSKRQRTILDAELKFLKASGAEQEQPFLVEGLKAAANTQSGNKVSTLVIQFFLYEPQSKTSRDVTHIIQDDGVSWKTVSRIDNLTNYIDADDNYTVNSALVSSVTDAGAMEIITVINADNPTSNESLSCYGSQTLATEVNGGLTPRTPHRYVCSEARSSSGAG